MGGKYALSAIKEVAGTSPFLSMDQKIKLCQSEETYHHCMTKEFIKKGLEACGCVPFKLRDFTKNETVCLPKGNQCYMALTVDFEKCSAPCEGLYADIEQSQDFTDITTKEDMSKVLIQYENFKNGFDNKNTNSMKIAGYQRKTKLHWVKIYFATPTFDLIKKDEKANFETKFSTVGGTFGLLAGFSIISGVEIVYFLVKKFCSFLGKKK